MEAGSLNAGREDAWVEIMQSGPLRYADITRDRSSMFMFLEQY